MIEIHHYSLFADDLTVVGRFDIIRIASRRQTTFTALCRDALELAYRKRIEFVGKILEAMKFSALVPSAALPQGRLLLAAAYISVSGYLVRAGGDYVDWRHLPRIDRVQRVRRIMETGVA